MSPLPDPTQLRARTVALPPGPVIDPLDFLDDDGVLFASPALTLAGRGIAAQLDLPGGLADAPTVAAIEGWLAAVPVDNPLGCPGSGLTAQGALPFEGGAPGRLLVPTATYGRDDQGREWLTLVSPTGEPPGAPVGRPDQFRAWLAAQARPRPDPAGRPDPLAGVSARLVPEPAGYLEAVGEALDQLAGGRLTKVVLARCLEVEDPDPAPAAAVVRRLQAQEPSCTAFSHPVAGGRFVGASPELLVERRGHQVRCHPLAGTAPQADPHGAAFLLTSAKERAEHAAVVDEIVRGLRACCVSVVAEPAPSLVRLHSVTHLGTRIQATVSEGGPSALGLLAALHPTPAVGGVPVADALALITKLEPARRRQWAGPVGWIDAAGDGSFYIGIRSATLHPGGAHLCAGAGIVVGSDPPAELAETTLKLRPVLEAVRPGAGRLLDR